MSAIYSLDLVISVQGIKKCGISIVLPYFFKKMAEYSSKKILSPSPTPPTTTHVLGIESNGTPTTGPSWIEISLDLFSTVVQKSVHCVVKGQELQQDFVTYGRSSRTKTLWIGISLVCMILFLLWILTKKIRILS